MGSIDSVRPRAFASYIDEVADESTSKILNESLKKNEDIDLAYFTVLASRLVDAKYPPPGLCRRMLEMFMSELGISLTAKIFLDQPKEKNMLEKNLKRMAAFIEAETPIAICRWQSEDLLEGYYFSYPERRINQQSHLTELQTKIDEIDRLLSKE